MRKSKPAAPFKQPRGETPAHMVGLYPACYGDPGNCWLSCRAWYRVVDIGQFQSASSCQFTAAHARAYAHHPGCCAPRWTYTSNRSQGARPNEAEIPEHLLPLWQSFFNLPTPVPAKEQAIRIQIPAINVDVPVVQGDRWEQLKKGVGQQIGTPNPGSKGNIVLSGHNDVYGEVFRYLDQLEAGDEVLLYRAVRKYRYAITGTQMVEPTAVEVVAQTSDARVPLISCHPYLIDDHRTVVSLFYKANEDFLVQII